MSVYQTAVHLLEHKRAEHQRCIELINLQINEIWRREIADLAAGRISPAPDVPLLGDSATGLPVQPTDGGAGVPVQDRPESGDTGYQCESGSLEAMDRA